MEVKSDTGLSQTCHSKPRLRKPSLCVAALVLVILLLYRQGSRPPTQSINFGNNSHDDNISFEVNWPQWMVVKSKPVTFLPSLPADKLRLFPEDAPGEDRILDQLQYNIKNLGENESPPTKKTILLIDGQSAWGVYTGRAQFIRESCPVDHCTLTEHRQEAVRADAILFKDGYTKIYAKRPANQIWIIYHLESPEHTPTMPASEVSAFNWTATYRSDSDIVTPYYKWVYNPNVTSHDLGRNYAIGKAKKVAWFVSNCFADNDRLGYARQLSKYISVDIYGTCGDYYCPRSNQACFNMLNVDYKFYLAFENQNCRDFITEKFFFNGLQHDVIPIVMGARPQDYAAVAPNHSYIHVDNFAGPEMLAEYLHKLDKNDDLYNAYFKWKGTGEFIDTSFFCRVCALLHASARRKRAFNYADVDAWWRNGTCQERDKLDEATLQPLTGTTSGTPW